MITVMVDKVICSKCGVGIGISDWPFCPHGATKTVMIERDEIPGGLTVENYGRDPITFYSHTERRKYMKAHGLTEKERFSPFPGTDKDPQGIPNPAGYVDPKTRENARVLLTRQRGETGDGVQAGTFRDLTVTTVSTGAELRRALGIPESESPPDEF